MIKAFFKGFLRGFKRFGHSITSIINFVLLIPVYYIGIGITSIIGKLSKKHFLDLKLDKKAKTYWIEETIGKEPEESYYRQF